MRRPSHVGDVLDRVRRGFDECDRIRADGDYRQRTVIGGEAHAVHEHLSTVERAEICGLRVTQTDDAEQLVIDGIDDRNGVRELIGAVDPVAMTDALRLLGQRGLHGADLLPLRHDDFLRHAPQQLIPAVAQLRLRHLDRGLVMRNHHRDELGVRIARRHWSGRDPDQRDTGEQ